MKKIGLLILMSILLTGCDSESYDYKCVKTSNNEVYKKTETLRLGIDAGKVYKFTSEIIEEHPNDDSINNAYANYQNKYDNYNENNVVAEYKKNEKKLIATYYLDKSDIDKIKIELPFNFSLSEEKFISSLEKLEYKCTKEK